jgi:hypothetical protein
MAIIRANDPKASDTKHQILTTLGKMCEDQLSTATKHTLLDKLTTLMRGNAFDKATIEGMLGCECLIEENPETKERICSIHIPKQYVAASVSENRDDRWVRFAVNKALDLNFEQE